MKKIEKLTYEQEKELKTTLEKWLEIGRSTKRIDRIKSANAIKALYKVNGKQEPFIWFCDSPYQCLFIIHLLKSNLGGNLWDNLENNLENNLWNNFESNLESNLVNNLWNNLRDNLRKNLVNNLRNNLESNLVNNLVNNLESNLWSNLRDNLASNLASNLWSNLGSNLWNNLENNLRNNLWNNLESNLVNNLWNNLRDNLRKNLVNNLRNNLESNLVNNLVNNLENNLRNNLWNNFESNLWSNLRDNLRDNHLVDAKINFENYFGGSQWCGWKVFYDFCNKIGVQYSKKDKEILSLWMEEASECYWWFPFERIVFLSDRPTTLNLNKDGQLHHNTEPAMVFADGYSLYYVNGVNVPSWIIENPEEITEEKIKEEDDENIKQIMLNRIGFGRDKTILNNIYNLLES